MFLWKAAKWNKAHTFLNDSTQNRRCAFECWKLSPKTPASQGLLRMSSQPGKAAIVTPDRRRRRYARHRCEFPVVTTLFSGNQYQKLDAHCKDLSVAGIGLLLAAEVPIGEVVSLSFCLPGLTEPWEIRAVLRHRRGFHYGFEFLSLPQGRSAILKKYVEGLPRAD